MPNPSAVLNQSQINVSDKEQDEKIIAPALIVAGDDALENYTF